MATHYHDVCNADGANFVGALPGTTVPGPTADAGDTGYQLDGLTDYIAIPDKFGTVNKDGDYSIEFWVIPKVGGVGGRVCGAWGASGPPGGSQDLAIILSSTGVVGMDMGGGGVDVLTILSAGQCTPGVYSYVVITYSSSAGIAKIYVNGCFVGTGSITAAWNPDMVAPFCVGAQGTSNPTSPTNFFDGTIADFAYYVVPLPMQKIINHFAAREGVPAYPADSTFTGDYWANIIQDNPLVYYRCDETSGAQAVDRSGHNHHGAIGIGAHTLNEPSTIYDGDTCYELQEIASPTWDSSGAGIVTPLLNFYGNGSFSIEAWIDLTSLPVYNDGVIATTRGINQGVDGLGPRLSVLPDGRAEFSITASQVVTSPSALPNGQFNHVVATYNLKKLILYVNGVAVASLALGGAPPTPLSNLCWGFNPTNYLGNSEQLESALDECALYQYALTAERVYIHYLSWFGPISPPPPPVTTGTEDHYWDVQVFDQDNNLIDLPKADIESLSLVDSINGGSAASTITFIRDFNNIGQIAYLNRVLVWVWSGKIARMDNPTWAGYMVDIDQELLRTTGKITVHLEGDAKQLDRASVYEDVNPLVGGNPSLDAADYVRHLYTVYAPPGFCVLDCPTTLFDLLPGQYEMMKLGEVIDTVLKTGRDDLGLLVTWRVRTNSDLSRTLLVQSDQDPNTVSGVKFKYIFPREMCAKYVIHTKYSEITNVVTVQGGQNYITGTPVIGDFIDGDSVTAYGAWEDILSVWQLIDSAACTAYAQAYLDIHGNPQAQGDIELHAPDPSLLSGVWVQIQETPTVIKQMRIATARFEIGRSRVKQTLQPTAPTPYLDYAVYRLGLRSSNGMVNTVNKLPVNTQQSFVRTGGTVTVV